MLLRGRFFQKWTNELRSHHRFFLNINPSYQFSTKQPPPQKEIGNDIDAQFDKKIIELEHAGTYNLEEYVEEKFDHTEHTETKLLNLQKKENLLEELEKIYKTNKIIESSKEFRILFILLAKAKLYTELIEFLKHQLVHKKQEVTLQLYLLLISTFLASNNSNKHNDFRFIVAVFFSLKFENIGNQEALLYYLVKKVINYTSTLSEEHKSEKIELYKRFSAFLTSGKLQPHYDSKESEKLFKKILEYYVSCGENTLALEFITKILENLPKAAEHSNLIVVIFQCLLQFSEESESNFKSVDSLFLDLEEKMLISTSPLIFNYLNLLLKYNKIDSIKKFKQKYAREFSQEFLKTNKERKQFIINLIEKLQTNNFEYPEGNEGTASTKENALEKIIEKYRELGLQEDIFFYNVLLEKLKNSIHSSTTSGDDNINQIKFSDIFKRITENKEIEFNEFTIILLFKIQKEEKRKELKAAGQSENEEKLDEGVVKFYQLSKMKKITCKYLFKMLFNHYFAANDFQNAANVLKEIVHEIKSGYFMPRKQDIQFIIFNSIQLKNLAFIDEFIETLNSLKQNGLVDIEGVSSELDEYFSEDEQFQQKPEKNNRKNFSYVYQVPIQTFHHILEEKIEMNKINRIHYSKETEEIILKLFTTIEMIGDIEEDLKFYNIIFKFIRHQIHDEHLHPSPDHLPSSENHVHDTKLKKFQFENKNTKNIQEFVQYLLKRMQERNLQPDTFTLNELLMIYEKVNNFEEILHIIKSLSESSDGMSHTKNENKFNLAIFITLFRIFSKKHDVKIIESLYSKYLRYNFGENAIIFYYIFLFFLNNKRYTQLFEFYENEIKQKLLSGNPDKLELITPEIFNLILEAYFQVNYKDQAIKLYNEMKELKKVNKFTFITIMNYLVSDYESIYKLLNDVRELNFELDDFILSSLCSHLIKLNKFQELLEIVDSLPNLPTSTLNILLHYFSKVDQLKAKHKSQEYTKKITGTNETLPGTDNPNPQVTTNNAENQIQQEEDYFQHFESIKIKLLENYTKKAEGQEGKQKFDVVTYNTLFNIYLQYNQLKSFEDLYAEFNQLNIQPTAVTLFLILKYYSKTKNFGKIHEFMEEILIVKKYDYSMELINFYLTSFEENSEEIIKIYTRYEKIIDFDCPCFHIFLKHLRKMNRIKEMNSMFKKMIAKLRILPDFPIFHLIVTENIKINQFKNSNEKKEALELLDLVLQQLKANSEFYQSIPSHVHSHNTQERDKNIQSKESDEEPDNYFNLLSKLFFAYAKFSEIDRMYQVLLEIPIKKRTIQFYDCLFSNLHSKNHPLRQQMKEILKLIFVDCQPFLKIDNGFLFQLFKFLGSPPPAINYYTFNEIESMNFILTTLDNSKYPTPKGIFAMYFDFCTKKNNFPATSSVFKNLFKVKLDEGIFISVLKCYHNSPTRDIYFLTSFLNKLKFDSLHKEFIHTLFYQNNFSILKNSIIETANEFKVSRSPPPSSTSHSADKISEKKMNETLKSLYDLIMFSFSNLYFSRMKNSFLVDFLCIFSYFNDASTAQYFYEKSKKVFNPDVDCFNILFKLSANDRSFMSALLNDFISFRVVPNEEILSLLSPYLKANPPKKSLLRDYVTSLSNVENKERLLSLLKAPAPQ